MADHYTTLNGVSVAGGDSVDMESITYGSAPTTRKRTRTVITGTAAAAIADVVNSAPGTTAYGLPTRLCGPVILGSDPADTALALPVRIPGLVTDWSTQSLFSLPVKPSFPKVAGDALVNVPLWQVGVSARHGAGALSSNKVDSGDFNQLFADRFGRLATVHIDAGSVLWKANSYTTAQTGTTWWSAPGATARLALTHIVVAIGGTTGGRVTVWFGVAADTTYTEGTDQVVMDVEVIPSATRTEYYPLAVGEAAIYGPLNNALKITTSANITVRISGYGYIQDET